MNETEFQDVPERVISNRIFTNVVDLLVNNADGLTSEQRSNLKRCFLVYCRLADYQQEEEKRVYAHTYHKPWFICISRAINSLEPEQILGILLHEIGHFLGGREEHVADRFVRQKLGLVVEYKGKSSIQTCGYKQLFSKEEWYNIIR